MSGEDLKEKALQGSSFLQFLYNTGNSSKYSELPDDSMIWKK
jgi:hypothetical protein